MIPVSKTGWSWFESKVGRQLKGKIMIEGKEGDNSYEITIRILGNEVLGFGIKSSSTSNKWALIGLITLGVMVGILVNYGDALVALTTN